MQSQQDKKYLLQAIELAKAGIHQGAGGPFGAIIVRGNEIVGKSFNKVYVNIDPTAHAEVAAIRDACQNLQSRSLEGCTLYTSCEPCPMCFSAIYFAKISRIVYAATHEDAGRISGFGMEELYRELNSPLHTRHIPHEQMNRQEGLALFWEWEKLKSRSR